MVFLKRALRLTHKNATSGKSAYHHVGFDVGYRIDNFRPALFVRLPLDKEYADVSPNTIGGSVSVEF